MKRLSPVAILLLLTLAGCGTREEAATPTVATADNAPAATTPATGDEPAPATFADAPFTPYAAAPDAAANAAPRAADAPVADGVTTHEFWFSSLAPGADDPRIVDWIDDPCGMTPVAVVEKIPLDDPSLVPDFVVEFDTAGTELHRWGKPYSAEIVTIAGEELVFRATQDSAVWKDYRTDADGRITVVAGTIESTITGSAQAVTCPALPAFAGSDFVQCYEVADADGRKRLLAWEGACS